MIAENTRRDFLKTAAFTAAASALPQTLLSQPSSNKKLNILLYVVDDQGTTDAGCYGNDAIKTPGLDLLAHNGTRFTHAFCTTASCSASRSVILTGLYNHANGQYGHQHSYNHFITFPDIKSLPVLLEEAGYRTARIGKYHVAPPEVYRFGEKISMGAEVYRSKDAITKGGSPSSGANNCRSFIESKDNRPFFLYFCTTEPHRPFFRGGSDTFSPDDVIVPDYLPAGKTVLFGKLRDRLTKFHVVFHVPFHEKETAE